MDALLFLLIFIGFLSVGRVFTRNVWDLNFSSSVEAFVFSSALGSIIASLLITGLVFTGQVSPLTCWALLAILLLSGIGLWRRLWLDGIKTVFTSPVFFPSSLFKTTAQIILAILFLLALSLALAPAFSTDALVYHLEVPRAFLKAGGLVNLPNNIYSYFPQQIEMVYLFALALGSDSLAQLTGLGIAFLLLCALWQYYRQIGSTGYAWLVPLIFILTPTFFGVASSAYVDLQAATYVFLAFYSWENGCTRKQSGWFFLMALFTGAAVATKLTMIIILPLALLGLAIHGRSHKNTSQVAGQCVVLVLGSLILLLPWLARNYYFTGNPVAPFFLTFFGGENLMNWDITRSQQQFQYYSSFGMGHGVLEFLLLPINLTFFSEPHSLKFDGQIGILYFLLLPALFSLNRKSLPMVVVFLVLLVFWFIQTQYIRLLAPAFAFLSVLLVKGLEQGVEKHEAAVGKKEKYFFILLLAFGLMFNTSIIFKEWLHIQPLPYLLNKESRDQFLTRQISAYPLYRDANSMLGQKDKVLLVYMRNLGYLMDRPFYSDTLFEAHTLKKIIDEGVYAEDIIIRLKKLGITHILFNYKFIFGENSAFSLGEKGIIKNFLNQHAEQISRKNEFFLYRFVLDLKLGNPNSTSGLLSVPLNH
ncbi:MAG: hypothetical protein HOF21_16305 [Nitrospina sp.]|nr:hypothetical protein [Nitrospina sp.]MBT5633614.1 hypothetical protein [Nitrospina sp.]